MRKTHDSLCVRPNYALRQTLLVCCFVLSWNLKCFFFFNCLVVMFFCLCFCFCLFDFAFCLFCFHCFVLFGFVWGRLLLLILFYFVCLLVCLFVFVLDERGRMLFDLFVCGWFLFCFVVGCLVLFCFCFCGDIVYLSVPFLFVML